MFPATLFDYNGVLANDETVHLDAFRDALAPLGIALSAEAYWEKYLGFDDKGAFRAILEDHGRTPTDSEILALVAAKRPLYRARAEHSLPVFDGAASLVRRRADAGPVGIVSGALRDEIDLGLQRLDVAELVALVISAEDTRACKPDPHGYELGIAALTPLVGAAAAARALVIEDSMAGVEAAKGAGLPCIAVAHSYSERELSAAGADRTVAVLDAIDERALADLYLKLYA